MPKFATKNTLIGYSWNRVLKAVVVFEIKTLKFEKLQNLGQKMPYLGIFGLDL